VKLATSIFLYLLIAWGTLPSFAAGRFENPWISQKLGLAHHYYLEGKFQEFSLMVKSILETSSDSFERRNVLDLLNQVQENLGGGSLPVDWTLPSEFSSLEMRTLKNSNPRYTEHLVELEAAIPDSVEVEGFKLIPRGGTPILDYAGGIGEVQRLKDPQKKGWVRWNLSRSGNNPLPEGLYEIQAKLKGKEALNGWFILTEGRGQTDPSLLARKSSWGHTRVEFFQVSGHGAPKISTFVSHREVFTQSQPVFPLEERLTEMYRKAVEREILVVDPVRSQSWKTPSPYGGEGRILQLNHRRVHRFGDLILRQQVSSEVHLDER
jgi:hypothetical protein